MCQPNDRNHRFQIGVIGAGVCLPEISDNAEAVGREIARRGAILICGGMGGVMEAACRGAVQEGGITLGVLPTSNHRDGNRHLTAAIATGFGQGRNVLIPSSCDGVIAIAGGYGTLSEIGFCLKLAVPLVGLGSWEFGESFPAAEDPATAVKLLFERIRT